MSGILQGGGGSPSEEERKKMAELFKSYAPDGTGFKNAIESEGGGAGNASASLANYLNKTSVGPSPTIDYEYKPYVMPTETGEDEVDLSIEDAPSGEDYSDLLNSNGTPMPGHPDYSEWMTNNHGPDGNPDGMGGQVGADHNGYVGNTFVGIGNGLSSLGSVIPGFIGMGLHGVGQGMIGHDTTSIGPSGVGGVDGVDTHTTNGSFEVGEFSDNVATSAHGNAGVGSIGTNSAGDTVSVGYGAGQVDPSIANAAGFSVSGGSSGSGGNSFSGPTSGDPNSGRNNGGPIYGYANGGPIAEQEDPYAPMPLAEPMQATPFGGPLRANQVNTQREKPWYQNVGQSAVTSVITSALTGLLPFNKGGKVGYNHGGPIGSRVNYKEDIARKESAAKIKREDMKAVADVAVKMKGPLQQGE